MVATKIDAPRTTVVGVFEAPARAHDAVWHLKALGFEDEQIRVFSGDRTPPATPPIGQSAKLAMAGATTVAGTGLLWALGLAAGVIPAAAPLATGQMLGSVAMSAAGGALAVGLVGALVGMGVPKAEAEFYDEALRAGRTLVVVEARDRFDDAYNILRQNDARLLWTRTRRDPAATAAAWPLETRG